MKPSTRRWAQLLALLLGLSLVVAMVVPAFALNEDGKPAGPAIAPSSVAISQEMEDNKSTPSCTGTLLADGWVVTAKHCVVEPVEDEPSEDEGSSPSDEDSLPDEPEPEKLIAAQKLKVLELDPDPVAPLPEGSAKESAPIEVLNVVTDEAADVALIEIDIAQIKYTKPAILAQALPEIGATVRAVGTGPNSPEESEETPRFTYGDFTMTGLEQSPCLRPNMVYTSKKNGAAIVSGDSGGGLFDATGQLIGVVSEDDEAFYKTSTGKYFGVKPQTNYAVPVTSFFSLLKEAQVEGTSTLPDSEPHTCLSTDDSDPTDEGMMAVTKSLTIVNSSFPIEDEELLTAGVSWGPDGLELDARLEQPADVPSAVVVEVCLEGLKYCQKLSASSSQNADEPDDEEALEEYLFSPPEPKNFTWIDLKYEYKSSDEHSSNSQATPAATENQNAKSNSAVVAVVSGVVVLLLIVGVGVFCVRKYRKAEPK